MKCARFLAIGALVLTAQIAISACDEPGDVSEPGIITIKMLDSSFDPSSIAVSSGTEVTFKLPNRGQLPHNMHIASARGIFRESDWLSKPALSDPGTTGELRWTVPTGPGAYKFRCDIHEVEMTGTLTVE